MTRYNGDWGPAHPLWDEHLAWGPRLGDFYASHSYNDWMGMRCDSVGGDGFTNVPDEVDVFWNIATLVFIGQDKFPFTVPYVTIAQAARLADAFAYGVTKYGSVGGWRNVPVDDHLQAAGRHFNAWLRDPTSLDAESGLPHEAHFLARAVMIMQLRGTK